MLSKRALHLMAKPPASVIPYIQALPRTSDRPAHLLHITLLSFVDLARQPPEYLPALLHRLEGFGADAFHVIFDRIEERRYVTLRGSEPILGALEFQASITRFLTQRSFPFFGEPPEPHVTINYRGDGRGMESIEPISWLVEDVSLIESVHGQSRHIEHRRWRLRDKSS